MFKIKNNKGFTMVELLAAVTILGILATIAIVSVTNTMEKSHKEYDKKQNKLFTTAAQTYFTDNRSELPKKLLTTNTVTLQKLIEENYIEEIVDYKKKAYDKTKSVATVKKTGAGKYIYYSTLVSGDGKRIIFDDPENKKTSNNITAKILGYDASESSRTTTIDNVYYINNKLKINISLSGGGDGISSYQYKIEKLSTINSSTGKKYKISGEIVVDNTSFNDTITINAKDFANGIYRLHVYAYSYEGTTSISTKSKVFVIDKTKPKCDMKINGVKGNIEKTEMLDKQWYKNDEQNKAGVSVVMTIKDTNKYLARLEQTEYDSQKSKKLSLASANISKYRNETTSFTKKQTQDTTTNGQNWYGTVEDKAGNVAYCDTTVYLDRVNPKCSVTKTASDNTTIGLDSWTNKDYTATKKCIDEHSLCTKSSEAEWSAYYSATDGAVNNGTFTPGADKVEDKAGNIGECQELNIKIDKEKPTCSINLNGITNKYTFSDEFIQYYKSDTTGTISGNDRQGSGVNSTGVSKDGWPSATSNNQVTITNEFNGYIYGYVKDNVGNENSCITKNIIIDTETPECNGIDGCYSEYNNWCNTSNGGFFDVQCSDSNCYGAVLSTTGATQRDKDGIKYGSDFSRDVKAEGKSTVNWVIFDKAGNTKDCGTKTIKVDYTGPYFTKLENDDHKNGFYYNVHNRAKRTVYCNDDLSGVKAKSFGADFDRNGNFDKGENYSGRLEEIAYVDDNKYKLSYHYAATGYKHTMFICEDKAGNETKEFIDDPVTANGDDAICCYCRSVRAKSKTVGSGQNQKTITVSAHTEIIKPSSDMHKCGNQQTYTKNGATFTYNSGISNNTGDELYMSCRKCT